MTEVYREGGFNVCVENGMINISQEFDDEEEDEENYREVVVIDDDDEEEVEEQKEEEVEEDDKEEEGGGVEENGEGHEESEDDAVGDEELEEGVEVENVEGQKESEDVIVNVVGEEEFNDNDDQSSVEELSMKDVILVGDDDWSNIDDCKIKQEYDSADEEELIWRKYSAIEQPNTTTYQTSTIFTTPVVCSQSRPTAHEQSEPNETILQHILVTEPQPLCPMRSILKNNINQEVNRPTGSKFLLRDRTSIKRRSRLVEEEMEEEQHLRTAARRRSSKNKSESMEQMKRNKVGIRAKVLRDNDFEWRQIHHNITERNRRQEIAYLFDRLRQTVDYVAQVNDTEWHHHHMRNRNWRSKFATLNSAVKSIRNLEEQGKRLERERNAQRRLNTKLMGQRNLLRESNAKLIKQLMTQSTSSSFKNHHYSDYSSVEEEDDDDDDDEEEEEVEVED